MYTTRTRPAHLPRAPPPHHRPQFENLQAELADGPLDWHLTHGARCSHDDFNDLPQLESIDRW